ncbi:MAG: succinate dehydrogenase, hydrophobic membrane anchor protein, partial [Stellaceae bacterium]
VKSPLPAVFLILLLVTMFYHAALGLQVVIEDYIHSEAMKIATLLAMRVVCIVFAVRGIFAVLKIAFGA